jgi:hypothetical protein
MRIVGVQIELIDRLWVRNQSSMVGIEQQKKIGRRERADARNDRPGHWWEMDFVSGSRRLRISQST